MATQKHGLGDELINHLSSDALDSRLFEFIKNGIGPFHILANYRPNSSRTGVWKISSIRNKSCYYLKIFSRKERWSSEVYAYTNWLPPLKSYVPKLIDVFEQEGLYAILITSIDGVIMREADLDINSTTKVYHQAGELIKILHDSQSGIWFGCPDLNGNPIDLSPSKNPINYVYDSIQEMSNHCKEQNLLKPMEIELVQWAFQNIRVFEHVKLVPISWDSTPGNWLVDESGTLTGMIDFENMLWGIDVDHFSILFERYFVDNKVAMNAFFNGYGLEVLTEKKDQIQICCIKMAVADICYGTQNNAQVIVNYGRNLLQQVYDNKLLSL